MVESRTSWRDKLSTMLVAGKLGSEGVLLRSVYRRLIETLIAEGLSLRTESRSLLPHAKYLKHGLGEAGPPLIQLPRMKGGTWLDARTTADEKERFIDTAEGVTEEMIILSHEIGHHRSGFEHYEEILRRYDGHRAISEGEKQAVAIEEILAWAEGRRLLQQLGFTDFGRFEREAAERVASYQALWSMSPVSWSSTEP